MHNFMQDHAAALRNIV